MYTKNNPLTYVKENRLGAAQIRKLSKPALFNFYIRFQIGNSNQAANTLSHCPVTNDKSSSDIKSEQYKTVLYTVVCDDLTSTIKGIELPLDFKIKFKSGAPRIETSQKRIKSQHRVRW